MPTDDFDVQGFARDINVVLVLATLRDRPKHGYQIAQDVESGSNGLFNLRHGTLYPILHRLEKDGLIRGSWSTEGGGRRKKVYELTPTGQQQLDGRGRRVNEIFQSLADVVNGPGPATS